MERDNLLFNLTKSETTKSDQENELEEDEFSSLLKKGFTNGKLNLQYQERLSHAFHFPYQKAYPIQLELMNAICETIQNRKVSVFESPTGTGKTFSLLCGAGTWLVRQSKQQKEKHRLSCQTHHYQDKNERKRSWDDVSATPNVKDEQEFDASISFKREQSGKRLQSSTGSEVEYKNDKTESHWFEDREGDAHDGIQALTAKEEELDEFFSLQDSDMLELTPGEEGERKIDENCQDTQHKEAESKIIFTTRTHSQIEQFIRELKTTFFGQSYEANEKQDPTNPRSIPLRTVSFASRKQLCINEDVQKIRETLGMEAMNEECLELRRNRWKKKKLEKKKDESDQIKIQTNEIKTCPFMPQEEDKDGIIDPAILQYTEGVHQRPRDIEELVELGKSMDICPYYGVRKAAKDAQLITMTYNLLLNASARNSIGVSLENSIIIIDEAHNIIEKILQINSPIITSQEVELAILRIDLYLQKAKELEKSQQPIKFDQLSQILQRFDIYCGHNIGEEAKCMTPIEFMQNSGGDVDRAIVLQIDEWLNQEEIKLEEGEGPSLIIEIEGDDETKKKMEQLRSYKHAIRLALRSIQAFLLLLTNKELEGRIHLPDPQAKKEKDDEKKGEEEEKEEKGKKKEKRTWSLKYQLLDPAMVFKGIVDQARCVILAGGTMKPLSDFTHQLFPQLDPHRFTFFSCSHIVPRENLIFAITSKSASGTLLKYVYQDRSTPKTLYELMDMLIRLAEVIPHGVVVFLPSYTYLEELQKFWEEEPDQFERLKALKEVSVEKKDSMGINEILTGYSEAIDQFDRPFQMPKKKGALLFAVINAKLSEGINFKDNMGRAVIVVGMPFAHPEDPELVQRQEFIQRLHLKLEKENDFLPPLGTDAKSAGWELYVNSCMKSVNQSIGRVIRHENDYAAVILLDSRYELTRYQTRLPLWIRRSKYQHANFNQLISKLEAFFKPRN